MAGGNFRPMPFIGVHIDAVAKVIGVEAKAEAGRVNAFGVISIDAKATVTGVEVKAESGQIAASGIQNLQDEEWLILLAA
jgi:hypothetical protein